MRLDIIQGEVNFVLLDYTLRFFLFLGQEWFLIPLIVIGYFSPKRSAFYRAFLILLFTFIFNVYLKAIWKIPLPPELHSENFAFPSGHMQSALAFWLWLSFELNIIWFYLLAVFILIGIGSGLVHFGYHNFGDILGSIGFGIITLVCYILIIRLLQVTLKSNDFKNSKNYKNFRISDEFPLNIYLGLIVLIFSVIFINLTEVLRPHVWLGLGAMIGLIIGSFYEFQDNSIATLKARILKIILALLGIIVLYTFFYYIIKPLIYTSIHNVSHAAELLYFTEYFIIGLWFSRGASVLYKKILV